MAENVVTMDKIVALCKRRGLIFPASEIYGGIGNTYDYGHYGVLLKNNVKDAWWRAMVFERDDVVALDSAIIQHPQTWVASGHVGGFTDPLVDCTREFEQMEMEFFVAPDEAPRWYDYWCQERFDWYQRLGIRPDHLRLRAHDADELSHYSSGTSDVEYLFPIGWSELEGIANRGDFDLTAHARESGTKLAYKEANAGVEYVPHVIEPAAGADRAAHRVLAFLCDAYDEDSVGGEHRTVLRLHPALAPVKVAVFPLLRKDGHPELARTVFNDVRRRVAAEYDDGGNIGKRYRRQDEIGTPFAVTVDHQSLEDRTVTLRDRDSLEQERVPIDGLADELARRVAGPWTSPKLKA